ncbi:LAGLIDADG family homing endonuclease [Heyndrickxia coagulans]|uniref:LAGLIDADG family homing endonuclease n=1 Tax=Heyndrickxia coagulans TaxID=1398 RepID=UPI0007797596|nr:LAGLIDADG family homing endonuclease [Heyndrickxia coagulans]KYC67183.1 hypothetical protein B4100_3819 [Heyndrickxia coagulans]
MRKIEISHEEIAKLYETDGKSTKEIADMAGVSQRQITSILRQNGVKLRGKRRTGGYQVNVDFFKEWTPDMAYVLGFILTDGCVVGTTFSISQKDLTILQRINDAMKSNYPIRKHKNGKSYLYTLMIHRKEMVEDLLALGITERKSLTVVLPEVPAEFMPHFVRGVIDGDGWVHENGYTMSVTSGSKRFAYALHGEFNRRGFNSRVKRDSGVYRIFVSGKESMRKLGGWLYADCGVLCLERKRVRFPDAS